MSSQGNDFGSPFGGSPPGGQWYPAPPKQKKHTLRTILLTILGVFIALIIVGVAFGSSSSTKTSATPAAAGATPAASNAPVPVGTPAKDGAFAFTVQGMSCSTASLGGGQYAPSTTPPAGSEFCVLSMTVANDTSQGQTFDPTAQHAYNAGGTQFTASLSGMEYLPQNQVSAYESNINPGVSVPVQVLFVVPVGTTITTLHLHDSAFSGGVTAAA